MKRFRSFRLLVTVLTLCLLPALAGAEITENRRFIDVIDHKGGNVLDMVKLRSRLENGRKPVRVRGYCRSACTMLITMNNACLGPKATVGFHAPRIPGTAIIPPYVDQIMASYYRNGILKKWNQEWRGSLKMHVITARDYVRLDPQTKICDSIPVRN
ncbi:hypothetical protein FQV27_14715 [Paracoccus aurantiacus]|uniref:Uncharacterized protein n=1 Tax=Paracoccus aurantiacus TaxID=2599412 RepID=A0A5C6RZ11_9RHOB|nr:hypothetical protein [Paracoccus aurantiacus]TXB67846.1 hypothetical protein FQV27_14715 [Paracoccus aurantiacus]